MAAGSAGGGLQTGRAEVIWLAISGERRGVDVAAGDPAAVIGAGAATFAGAGGEVGAFGPAASGAAPAGAVNASSRTSQPPPA